MQSLAMQVLPAAVHSICMLEMDSYGGKSLYVNMGLVNGVLIRATIDRVHSFITLNPAVCVHHSGNRKSN